MLIVESWLDEPDFAKLLSFVMFEISREFSDSSLSMLRL